MPARGRFRHAHPPEKKFAQGRPFATLRAPTGDAFVHYRDRREAGCVLADWVEPVAGERPIVVAVAGGGVPVAVEVARALRAPLDVVVVQPLTLPAFPGRRFGAIAEDGTVVLDNELVGRLDVPLHDLADAIERERSASVRRASTCRAGAAMRPLTGRTVVVVDDGVDGGLAASSAVRAVRRRDPASVVVAVPVASRAAVQRLACEADHVVAPVMPMSVGGRERWYRSFSRVTDADVADLMQGVEHR